MGRVIAIDYGRKRSGVAVTDPLRICATGLPTVRSCDLIDFLRSYMEAETVDCIVVGLPLTMRGEPSESSRYIEPFIRQLHNSFPEMRIDRIDERFTSAIAHKEMALAGLKKKKREEKALADKTAAVLILTDWLNSAANAPV
ncbi:MAG: Holliday junction resolvase RuvX [Muribaculaceae bacterium]|nr:Holliday junction resolvase RuvX [Muribaculaceae bacterium]